LKYLKKSEFALTFHFRSNKSIQSIYQAVITKIAGFRIEIKGLEDL